MQKKGQEELKRNKKEGQLGQDKTGAARVSRWHPASTPLPTTPSWCLRRGPEEAPGLFSPLNTKRVPLTSTQGEGSCSRQAEPHEACLLEAFCLCFSEGGPQRSSPRLRPLAARCAGACGAWGRGDPQGAIRKGILAVVHCPGRSKLK